jgi:hypothetical protein
MIEDFEFADCWKNIADPHEDFGLVTEWCACIDGVWPEWIDAAKTNQPMKVLGDLRAGPVIFSHYVRIFLWKGWFASCPIPTRPEPASSTLSRAAG